MWRYVPLYVTLCDTFNMPTLHNCGNIGIPDLGKPVSEASSKAYENTTLLKAVPTRVPLFAIIP